MLLLSLKATSRTLQAADSSAIRPSTSTRARCDLRAEEPSSRAWAVGSDEQVCDTISEKVLTGPEWTSQLHAVVTRRTGEAVLRLRRERYANPGVALRRGESTVRRGLRCVH